MRRRRVLTVIAGVGSGGHDGAPAQQPAQRDRNVAQIEKVKDNLFMVTGGGGNTAAFVTANGVVLVDTKLANWGQAILDQVRTVTDKPVTTSSTPTRTATTSAATSSSRRASRLSRTPTPAPTWRR